MNHSFIQLRDVMFNGMGKALVDSWIRLLEPRRKPEGECQERWIEGETV